MRRTFGGWVLMVSGLLTCPCHLPLTLPFAVALLSGSALGGWLANYEGAIVAAASLYFVGAVVLGVLLLIRFPFHFQVREPRDHRTGPAPCKHCLRGTEQHSEL
ncbi:MAG TPA: hypothetical protein VKQ30_05805 [Ktedonobacterales bacterium]|nr:hypothetical protein [Ktedonobacterales bacterium]